MAKKGKIAALILGPAVLLAVAAVAGYLYYKYRYIPEFEARVLSVNKAIERGVKEKILLSKALIVSSETGKHYKITARMPLRFTPESLKKKLAEIAELAGADVSFKEVGFDRLQSVNAEFAVGSKVISQARFIRNAKPKLCVIIDDWGYNSKPFKYLSSIKQHFAPAVLPGLAFSARAVQEAAAAGKEIMLHLPLEPKREMPEEKNVIKKGMSEGEILYIVERQLSLVPGAAGINNHEGSLVTEDARVMGIIMKAIRDKNLYFVDSVTAERSVVMATAKAAEVLSAKRHVFLDNEKKAGYIRKQINELKEMAKKRGYAVGIGHADLTTMQVLAEDMPLIEKEGFEFVTPAEVVR